MARFKPDSTEPWFVGDGGSALDAVTSEFRAPAELASVERMILHYTLPPNVSRRRVSRRNAAAHETTGSGGVALYSAESLALPRQAR
jgi:hypothetical protein